MSRFSKSITIAASPEQVFDIIDDTANLPKFWRNLSNIHDLVRIPNGGHSLSFDYTMAGIKINASSIDLEHKRPDRIVTRTNGGVISTLTWAFTGNADNTQTTVTLDVEYEVPIPLVGRLAENIITKINETDIIYLLNYLKLMFK